MNSSVQNLIRSKKQIKNSAGRGKNKNNNNGKRRNAPSGGVIRVPNMNAKINRNGKQRKNNKNSIIQYKSGARVPRMLSYDDVSDRFKISKFEEVRFAYDNLFALDGINGAGPVPLDCNNKRLVAANISGNVNTVLNYKPAASIFKVLMLQHMHPLCPLLITSPALNGVPFFALGNPGAIPEALAVLEVYSSSPWGFWRADRATFAGMLSVLNITPVTGYPGNNLAHKWAFEFTGDGVNALLALQFITSLNGTAITVYTRIDGVSPWSAFSGVCPLLANPVIPIDGANHLLEVAIYINSEDFKYLELSSYQDNRAGNNANRIRFINPNTAIVPVDYPNWIYNLDSAMTTNYNYINARSNSTRLNRTALVITNVMADIYAGGNAQVGKIYSNEVPQQDYDSYLWTLQTKRLGNLKGGETTLLFAATPEDWGFRATPTYNFNNLANPNTTVNMIILSNVAVNGTNDSLPLQLKFDAWVDYSTPDNTLATVEVTAHADEWPTIMGYVTANYTFCDNITHQQVLAGLKKAVSFMVSGDPRAVAIRKAAVGLGKGAAVVLGSLLL